MPRVYRYPPLEQEPPPPKQSEAPLWLFAVAIVLIAVCFAAVSHYDAIGECVSDCYPSRAYYEGGYCYCATEWRAP